MPSPVPLHVECPGCRAALSVDPASGAVLSHRPAAAPAGSKPDMDRALEGLRQDKGRREDLFRQSMSAEMNKGDLLKQKFDEAVRRAKESPDAAPPPREVDL